MKKSMTVLAAEQARQCSAPGGTGAEAGLPAGVLQPVRLPPAFLQGEGLAPLAPWPQHMQLRPIASHRLVQWYAGEKISSMIYDADDGLLEFIDLPYDEQVTVLNGEAVLTSQDGERHVFVKGDVFVAPKGWTGTWELRDGYRELITFETGSLAYAMQKWFE
jgi:uncharacterized cupin superfamily protein